ncbi:MAG: hypothetical protein IJJ59_13530 [Pseudobutyrivibrio sp.]|uniref:hypothetical protein n=1 Tax=Pseudobutyrivibrio sp. TaxID=2014367 RepID=UPI0025F91B9A|nr:hypothetical protein [Pseudobutyrivibrio sp.]MBQ6464342.1 hypothetical protein [Pseudobutyrivibrio sp.]
MKKTYAVLIVIVIALNPIIAFATGGDSIDEVIEQTSETQNKETSPAVPGETPAGTPADVTPEIAPNPNTTPDVQDETLINDPESNENITPVVPDDAQTNLDTTQNSEESLNPVPEDTPGIESTVENNAISEETTSDESKLVHEHSFTYTENGDGTHTKKCTEKINSKPEDESSTEDILKDCDCEEVEECTYDENNICIYCGSKKPEEKIVFEPSISISVSNDNCKIGESNPLIEMQLSDSNFDIAYAQVCFADYSNNQYINVGLSQGKYYDSSQESFVQTGNDKWYACPDIKQDYKSGKLSMRSLFIRSTTGEFVHYSLESDSLPEAYSNICVNLTNDEAAQQEPATDDVITEPEPYETPEHGSGEYIQPEIPEEEPTPDEGNVPADPNPDSDSDTKPETGNTPETDNNPGTGTTPETGNNPGTGTTPETGNNSGTGTTPETGNNPGTGDTPDTGNNPGTEIKPGSESAETPETPDDSGAVSPTTPSDYNKSEENIDDTKTSEDSESSQDTKKDNKNDKKNENAEKIAQWQKQQMENLKKAMEQFFNNLKKWFRFW